MSHVSNMVYAPTDSILTLLGSTKSFSSRQDYAGVYQQGVVVLSFKYAATFPSVFRNNSANTSIYGIESIQYVMQFNTIPMIKAKVLKIRGKSKP